MHGIVWGSTVGQVSQEDLDHADIDGKSKTPGSLGIVVQLKVHIFLGAGPARPPPIRLFDFDFHVFMHTQTLMTRILCWALLKIG